MRVDGSALEGTLLDLSASGVRARITEQLEARAALTVGAGVRLSFDLTDEHGPVEADAEVVWTDPQLRDPVGRSAVAVGMRLVEPDVALSTRLADFVRDSPHTVLIVDDEDDARRAMVRALKHRFRLVVCASAAEALELIELHEVAVLLIDYCMPEVNGEQLLEMISTRRPAFAGQSIIVSGHLDLAAKLNELASRRAILAWISKPFSGTELRRIVERAVAEYVSAAERALLRENLSREIDEVRRCLAIESAPDAILGNSTATREIVDRVAKVARTDATVLVCGESGTGKELVAQAIHRTSARAAGPFIAVNCGSMPRDLVDTELFGHVAGAFTDGRVAKRGLFQAADGGTLFLDEVATLDPAAQVKLLRALQSHEVRQVGASVSTRLDVRVIAATNHDLDKLVSKGTFREDLYYRLAVVVIGIPPLRNRAEDIMLLAEHFLRRFAGQHHRPVEGFAPQVIAAFARYPWPGNVRELQNVVESATIEAGGQETIRLEHLKKQIRPYARQGVTQPPSSERGSYDELVRDYQRQLISGALRTSGGTIRGAARHLQMDHSRLSKLIRRLGVAVPRH